MDRGNIFSGGAFRVTVYATTVLVALCITVAFAGYRYIQNEQINQLRGFLAPIGTALHTIQQGEGDAEFLIDARILSRQLEPSGRLIAVFDATGEQIIGARRVTPDITDWSVRALPGPDGTPGQEYYLTASTIGTHTLVVGASLEPVERIGEAFIRILFLITAFLSIIFIALGYATSRMVQLKLERLGDTLALVGEGHTDARLPVSPANDQIDRVARRMNGHLATLSGLMSATKSSAAAIAHDLKRPLARALLGVDRALAQVDKGADPQAALEDTRHELANLTGMFETILRIARIDAGHGEGLGGSVDLADLARDLGETFQVVAEESGQSLALVVPEGRAPVRGDAGMLSQMLVNLLQNAVTHGPPGNNITLSLTCEGRDLCLSVADTGPGIAEPDRTSVLAPFFRADTARTTEGNGLGLALVKSVTDRHGAILTLSDNAPGLRVTVRFPGAVPT